MKYLILFAIAIVGVLFGVSNQQNATVHFFWYFSKTYPLYLVLFTSFFAGTIVAILYGIMASGGAKDNERSLERHIKELKELLKKTQAVRSHDQVSPSTGGQTGFF
jgi:uncharacterized integral membrane protein